MKEGDTVVLVHVPDMCDVAAATGKTYLRINIMTGIYAPLVSNVDCSTFGLKYRKSVRD